MAQPAPAPKNAPNAVVELTYNSDGTWSVKGDSFPIPKSGIVQFDIDPKDAPVCYIYCTPSSTPPAKGGLGGVGGGGFTVPVGSGPVGGGGRR